MREYAAQIHRRTRRGIRGIRGYPVGLKMAGYPVGLKPNGEKIVKKKNVMLKNRYDTVFMTAQNNVTARAISGS